LIEYLSFTLSPYIHEINGDQQCGFRCNRSITDQIFCIRQILENKWEYNETLYQLLIGFKKAYDSVRRKAIIQYSHRVLSRYQNADQKREIKTANRSFENVSQFKCLGTTVTNQDLIQNEIKRRLSGIACYLSVQNLFSRLLSKNVKIIIH
jgi:hypothetical protein